MQSADEKKPLRPPFTSEPLLDFEVYNQKNDLIWLKFREFHLRPKDELFAEFKTNPDGIKSYAILTELYTKGQPASPKYQMEVKNEFDRLYRGAINEDLNDLNEAAKAGNLAAAVFVHLSTQQSPREIEQILENAASENIMLAKFALSYKRLSVLGPGIEADAKDMDCMKTAAEQQEPNACVWTGDHSPREKSTPFFELAAKSGKPDALIQLGQHALEEKEFGKAYLYYRALNYPHPYPIKYQVDRYKQTKDLQALYHMGTRIEKIQNNSTKTADFKEWSDDSYRSLPQTIENDFNYMAIHYQKTFTDLLAGETKREQYRIFHLLNPTAQQAIRKFIMEKQAEISAAIPGGAEPKPTSTPTFTRDITSLTASYVLPTFNLDTPLSAEDEWREVCSLIARHSMSMTSVKATLWSDEKKSAKEENPNTSAAADLKPK